MGDKTIPDSAEPHLESFYPPFIAGIDLPHQGVVDSYSLSQLEKYISVKMMQQCFKLKFHLSRPSYIICYNFYLPRVKLTHWGWMPHICVSKIIILGSDNGLSPGRRQAIIWTNAAMLLIWPWGTNFSEILIAIDIFSFKKMHFEMSSGKWRLFCLSRNVLNWSSPIFGHQGRLGDH